MSQTPRAASINHRTLVGQQRRERTRHKILVAALKVFAQKGSEAPVIEDFIAEAGIARGTFYNYFSTTQELLQATLVWLGADLIASIEHEIGALTDPLLRLTTGARLWLGRAACDPTWAAFIARPEFLDALPYDSVFAPVMDDLQTGRQSGLFHFPDTRAALSLLTGTLLIAMRTYLRGTPYPEYDTDIVRIILQGLGVAPDRVATVLAQPLPTLRRTPMSLKSN
ncbi:MAG: TetR/AcrR family transcriptional regulator [Paludibacterium sp.]|uniref:TetR/AcrR family transcriptional regulator n=1 Tax=Paludibacterium sp. TaxID=1917523 RepID=UPI0025EFE5A1|nr:TetR/AcrR family transcriptional regulator [Paludibacterium sp.]MBV8047383.1 TetR/AcrR family transcriptional regulator [Paludibacterium sp.]MBV8646844.1 TetR/AcrR family transcriptional regulator [Paludibacterium sp.]